MPDAHSTSPEGPPRTHPHTPSTATSTGGQLAELAAEVGPVSIETPAPEPRTDGPRSIALINQKGGVGKTTTTANLGAALAESGQRVLLIDLDPQAHLTLHFGMDPNELDCTTYDLLTDPAVTAADVAHQVRDNLAILPASVNLAGAESELADQAAGGSAQQIMRDKTRAMLADNTWFDVAMIDCPPSLGLLTISALATATEVVVPMQAHFLALQGLSELLKTVQLVTQSLNPRLVVSGIILCMHEAHTILAGEITNDLTQFLEQARPTNLPWSGARLLTPPVRRNIKLAESPSFGSTIFDYAPNCPGAEDYRALAQSLLAAATSSRPS